MAVLYICQDGEGPSGVATYGYEILGRFADARMLLLNASRAPISSPQAVRKRIRLLRPALSHDEVAVAEAIRELGASLAGEVTIMPNTGDIPWSATAQFLRGLAVSERQRVRVLGVVHSDTSTQFALAIRYADIAPIWIGVSWRCSDQLRQTVGARISAIYELPYPIETAARTQRVRSALLRLVYLGRLEEQQKRVSRLPELFAALDRRNVPFLATVAGDGPARRDLELALSQLRPETRCKISCVGNIGRDQIAQLWRKSDVVLLVSAYEGMPLALLEAMSAGCCPVVMACDSGIGELIGDRYNGRILPQGDVEGMALALEQLASDRRTLRRMGARAREKVASQFSIKTHFEQFERILARLWTMAAPDPRDVVRCDSAAAAEKIAAAAAERSSSVCVFGAGMFGRKVIDACFDRGLEVVAWFDSDVALEGRRYRKLKCRRPEEVALWSEQLFIAASGQFAKEMELRIEREFHQVGLTPPNVISPP